MRLPLDSDSLQEFMSALGREVRGPGTVYLTGGATALLHGWRQSTIGVDLKADPEPQGLFEAIAHLKDSLQINIELASPDHFIPELPGWRERSAFIASHGSIEFRHYDYYSQALSKIERGHDRDIADVASILSSGLIQRDRLWELYETIESRLIRYPAIDIPQFRTAVRAIVHP